MSWTCGNILLFLDSKVNDFHSEADSNDGRSSGKIIIKIMNDIIFYLFIPLFDLLNHVKLKTQSRYNPTLCWVDCVACL